MRALAIVFVLLCACGGGSPASVRHAATHREQRVAATRGSIELALRRSDGSFVDVGELRGRVVLLFVFATFDAMSQLVLHPLRAVVEESPELRVIGIAAQMDARLLIDPYEHALNPPFVVTYDPEDTVQTGRSMLGELEAVPTFIVLDRRGVPVARHTGFIDADGLRELLAAAH